MFLSKRTLYSLALIFSTISAFDAALGGQKPNVIIIYCDDLGYGDVNLYGKSPQRTPEIQKMAAEGMVFTNFYSTSGVCTPSRSSLMTGSYPRNVGLHESENGAWVLFPANARGINENEQTIADDFKDAGYYTAIVGKWHLGDQPEFFPTRHGFDTWLGIPYSNNMYYKYREHQVHWPPLPMMRDEMVLEKDPDQDLLTERYTREAINIIRNRKEKPFFIYLPHAMPHFPVHASKEFRGKSDNGIYGDAVEELDASTGRILDALREEGIADNTLVIFTSDNGAEQGEKLSNLPLRGHKGTTLEGGMRVPMVVWWPGKVPAGSRIDALATMMDWKPTLQKIVSGKMDVSDPVDGHDISSILYGLSDASPYDEGFAYYYVSELQCVRKGSWKLHLPRTAKSRDGKLEQIPLQLYHLETDISESHNLAEQYPHVVKELLQVAEKFKHEVGHMDRIGTQSREAGFVSDPQPILPIPNDG